MRKRKGEARENRHVRNRPSGPAKGNLLGEEDLVAKVAAGEVNFILILDCVQDPHNLGAILRSADGAGVQAVVVPKDKAVGLTDTVRRISVGAADSVPFVRVTNLSRSMKSLQEAGMWLVGTSDKADKTLFETDLQGKLGIVIGAEGDGLRRLTEEGCDFLVKLPMLGSVPCLNASVATGVCLYEALRQRMQGAGE
ncbi:23S rRNA (guanosine(2251)-2'-O)-methyltransferase RlmB [Roseibacillus ishigakijimensis]|uniref:23S rRNA (Guanosine(2251)-2'-O)-methyltransferase RlmB n=1 Tax=Roseibacillus ishigakijimensis TaxID=454146 RepID=A0A934RM67_9BACT|nr:23S rRNA (guanosine(2251)-2'-O)-methyltransferase RlmB [Roseibacillus ishigakijimensis]MBK1834337.1 23S rRNA (guanosine(2251)-2'-O)-methyltransferase RlmB [Roseibacillus ishigakijimensis]